MGRKLPFLLRLGRHSKQAGDERHLPEDVSFFHATHLPFPDHVHHLVALQGSRDMDVHLSLAVHSGQAVLPLHRYHLHPLWRRCGSRFFSYQLPGQGTSWSVLACGQRQVVAASPESPRWPNTPRSCH
jgi:hypothetical protein